MVKEGEIVVCGLFEYELVKKGLMKKGRCRDCFHWDGSVQSPICTKNGVELLDKEKTDCKEWVIDTR